MHFSHVRFRKLLGLGLGFTWTSPFLILSKFFLSISIKLFKASLLVICFLVTFCFLRHRYEWLAKIFQQLGNFNNFRYSLKLFSFVFMFHFLTLHKLWFVLLVYPLQLVLFFMLAVNRHVTMIVLFEVVFLCSHQWRTFWCQLCASCFSTIFFSLAFL